MNQIHETAVRFRLFGGFAVSPSSAFGTELGPKPAGLAAYLCRMPGHTATREKLAALLWGTADSESARTNLRQALVKLRRHLGPQGADLLVTGRATVSLGSGQFSCDAGDFLLAIERGDFAAASRLYTGPFLDGITIRVRAFDDWAAAERRRLADLHLAALENLARSGTAAERVVLARKLVDADPLRESAHRLLAEALADTGKRDAALRHLREVEVLLHRELGVRPTAETLALKRRLQTVELAPNAKGDPPVPVVPDGPVLAVHPFTSLDDSRAHRGFAAALTAGVITTLSKLPYLRVTAHGSAHRSRDLAEDLAALDRVARAEYMLEGSVSGADDKVRVSARLINCLTGEYSFTSRYDCSLSDPFSAQDEVALGIGVAINVALLQGEQALSKLGRSGKLDAWELVLQASTLISSHDRTSWPAARRCIDAAIRLDPDYSAAHTLLGWWHWGSAFCGWSTDPAASIAGALAAAAKGHALDPDNPEPFVVTGIARMQARDYDGAERALEEARKLGPNHAMVAAVAANVAMFAGHPAEAQQHSRVAMRLCPVYPPWYAGDMAQSCLQLGQLEMALDWARAAVTRSASYFHAYLFLLIAHHELGQHNEAAAAARAVLRHDPSFSAVAWAAAQPFRDPAINQRFLSALLASGLT